MAKKEKLTHAQKNLRASREYKAIQQDINDAGKSGNRIASALGDLLKENLKTATEISKVTTSHVQAMNNIVHLAGEDIDIRSKISKSGNKVLE